jgi:tetratricopeptide (TPR) repeat protein
MSLNGQRVIHPESDWLWMASEMGWFSVLFCIVGIGGLLIRDIHSSTRREKELRLAGLIALGVFLVNSLIDVPGHRLGTILPILLLASLCTRPRLFGESALILPWASRISGIGLLAFGVFLVREANLKAQTERAVVEGEWARAEEAASELLVRQPLSWSLYVTRGYAAVHQSRWLKANTDFRYARFLEPKMAIVPFNEGKAWVGVNRVLALVAWREALRRSQSAEMRDFYGQMLDASSGDSQLHLATIRLADSWPSLALLTLDPGSVDSKTLQVLESQRSRLTAEEILALTRAEAWKAAAAGDFEKAYELGRLAMRRIQFPMRNAQSVEQCRDALIRDPRDFAAAFNLCSILQARERWQDALEVLEPISRDSNCPVYILVMKAETLASQQKWSEAWTAIGELVR